MDTSKLSSYAFTVAVSSAIVCAFSLGYAFATTKVRKQKSDTEDSDRRRHFDPQRPLSGHNSFSNPSNCPMVQQDSPRHIEIDHHYEQESSLVDCSSETSGQILCVYCDERGYIIETEERFCQYLGYNRSMVLNQFVGCLMTPHMNLLHKKMFISAYKNGDSLARNRYLHCLSSRTHERPIIVYNVNREPLFVNLHVEELKDLGKLRDSPQLQDQNYHSEYYFRVCMRPRIAQDESAYFYTDSIRDLRATCKNFTPSKTKMVVICIDFMNSTELLVSRGPYNLAHVNKRFYEDIIDIIRHYFYPYISIHEIIGDCFVLVLNASWTYNLPQFCATLAINFVNHLYCRSHSYVNMRVGISYGEIIYGFIGPSLRFFGDSMHVASRLEGKGVLGNALVNQEFYQKLLSECTGFGKDAVNHLVGISSPTELYLKGYAEPTASYLIKLRYHAEEVSGKSKTHCEHCGADLISIPLEQFEDPIDLSTTDHPHGDLPCTNTTHDFHKHGI